MVEGVPVVRGRVAGVQLDRPPEFPAGPGPIPFIQGLQIPERGVRLRPRFVNRDSSHGRCFRPGVGVLRFEQTPGSQHQEGVGQPRPPQRVVRILTDRLLKGLRAFSQVLFRPGVPEVATEKIRPVCFRIYSVRRRQAALLFPTQLDSQLLSDLAHNVLLDLENVDAGPVVLLAPEQRVVVRPDQLRAHRNRIAAQSQSAPQHDAGSQLAADLPGLSLACATNRKTVSRDRTLRFGSRERSVIKLSLMPWHRYSASGFPPALANRNTNRK